MTEVATDDNFLDINSFLITGGDESDAIFTGGVTKYFNDHNKPATKDHVVEKLLPSSLPECLGSVVDGHCISKRVLEKIDNIINTSPDGKSWKVLGTSEVTSEVTSDSNTPATRAKSHVQIVQQAKEKLGCDTEICILEALEPQLGRALVSNEISTNFKVKGPTDNKLLSNVNIDAVMKRYANLFPGFYPYNFNMRNYASYSFRKGYVENSPDSLATVRFADLYANGDKCCGCVINDDTYQGPGTHWMALFADARGGKWSVEFFNSSGNAPAPEWVNWLTKIKSQMEDIIDRLHNPATSTGVGNNVGNNVSTGASTGASTSKIITKEDARKFCCGEVKKPQKIDIICCSEIRHQQSKTECGLYSLFYIFARLNGIPYEYFMKNPVPDQLMFEFRQLLFNGEKGLSGGKFNWDQFRKQVSVVWE